MSHTHITEYTHASLWVWWNIHCQYVFVQRRTDTNESETKIDFKTKQRRTRDYLFSVVTMFVCVYILLFC